MKRYILLLFVGLAGNVWAQFEPGVGYLYPAGARQGTVVKVVAGGQYIKQPKAVHVSGDGVSVSIVGHMKQPKNLNTEQRWLLLKSLLDVWDKHLKEAGTEPEGIEALHAILLKKGPWSTLNKKDIDVEGEKVPDHPLLMDLENKSPRELTHIMDYMFFPKNKLQINRQLDEMVVLQVTVDPDATPGLRELRLETKQGLTKPLLFQVSELAEVNELEPNNIEAYPEIKDFLKLKDIIKSESLELPVLLNGQIMPGDIDRFRFRAKKGQNLTIQGAARKLVPYLADAVPGWFQATLALYDSKGKELAFADDYRFDPDPVLFFTVPEDGEYELEIRDSIYRGREDFVYRVAINTKPVKLDTFPRNTGPADVFPREEKELPGCVEKDAGNGIKRAQDISMPMVVSGSINKPDDKDTFRIKGNEGDKIVAEVYARRLGSPLDSLLKLMDASGKVIAWNDDHMVKNKHLHIDRLGLDTHHADSYLEAELPAKGEYYVQISDVRRHGDKDHGYRLRISEPRPDFSLRTTPSGIFTRPGSMIPLTVYALRKDGFDGEIKVGLKDDDAGFELKGGAVIPAGQNSIQLTVRAPVKAPEGPVEFILKGTALVNGEKISRLAIPADDVMQAFLYRHLVPAKKLMCVVLKQKWAVPEMEFAGDGPVRLQAGKTVPVEIKMKPRSDLDRIRLSLSNPPEGIAVEENVTKLENGMQMNLKVSKDAKAVGYSGNLIIQMSRTWTVPAKDGKPEKKGRSPMGFLPAIPVQVVKK